MFTRGLVTVVIVANSLLGHLCMMPMAYAASMPMQHDEAIEMSMTPMHPMAQSLASDVPMSALHHCEHCEQVHQQNSSPMNGGCAGHCLAKAHDTVAAVTSAPSADHMPVALVPTFSTIAEPAHVKGKVVTSTAPPFDLALARSVVMIQ